jgi:hypothetical protein
MKVVAISNFNLDSVPDRLIIEHVTKEQAIAICEEHNSTMHKTDDYYYVVKEYNYKLWEGTEEYV